MKPETRVLPTDESERYNKKTILIIEDQEGFRQIFTDILEHGGYDIVQAEDGQKGLELAQKIKPDLILLDLMLPKLHGFKVLEHIRSHPQIRRIPIIILSVLEEPANRAKSLELGANDYLVKAFLSPPQILEKIAALLK